jgi:hypothetical protein
VQWVSTRLFASEYPSEAIGKPYEQPYADELWLNVSNAGVRAVILKVLDLAAAKGCDFVEPDNVQGALSKPARLSPALTRTDAD